SPQVGGTAGADNDPIRIQTGAGGEKNKGGGMGNICRPGEGLPVVAEGGAVTRVAGGGPGGGADAGAEEADAAVAEADVHAAAVRRLGPDRVAAPDPGRLHLEQRAGRVAGRRRLLAGVVDAEDRPPDAVGVGPEIAEGAAGVDHAAAAAGPVPLGEENGV